MPTRPEGGARVPARERAWPVPWEGLEELAALGWLDLADLEAVPEPRWRTPTPADRPSIAPGAWWDLPRVVRVLDALSRMRHTKGRWSGRSFVPEAWQIAYLISPVFGWVHETSLDDGSIEVVRLVREALVEIPRKNGKSTLAAGLGVVLLVADGEAGAEVYAAATSRDQAGTVHEEAKAMISTAVDLAGKVRPLSRVIRVPRTASVFRVLSKVAEAAHGLNVSGAIVDELHVHQSRDLLDAILTGTGARAQPLVILLTTADEGDDSTIYAERHNDVITLAESDGDAAVDIDPASYGVIFAADEDADPLDPATWAQANPGLGKTVSVDYIEAQARKARRLPSYAPVFERLHLNLRRSSVGRWLPLSKWDLCAGSTSALDFPTLHAGDRAFGGVDLGSTDDFTAWALVIPTVLPWRTLDDEGNLTGEVVEVEGFRAVVRCFVPEGALERRAKVAPSLRRWARDGWLTITPGDATDQGLVQAQIEADAETFAIEEFAFDPWQSDRLRQDLEDGGLIGWRCSQRLSAMARPSKELERLVLGRGLDHGGNPVLRWMVRNAIAFRDADDNVKPDKRKSREKIDGLVALVMALGCAIREPEADTGKTGVALIVSGDSAT